MQVLSPRPLPDWLASANVLAQPPMDALLADSVYYPACGTDGRPVQYLGGHCHSFVYVDYGVQARTLVAACRTKNGFSGYILVGGRLLDMAELAGPHSFTAVPVLAAIDGSPDRYNDHRVPPFAYWAIFERSDFLGEAHGPKRFSLLYVAGEGAATYNSLYGSHRVRPEVLAIIQPGQSFGYNWTNFHDHRQILGRTVAQTDGGGPAYLLLGGRGLDLTTQKGMQWPGYETMVKFWKTTEGYMGLWSRGCGSIPRMADQIASECGQNRLT